MNSAIHKSLKASTFILATWLLASCGGGGSDSGGFTNPADVLDMEWTSSDGTNQMDWFFASPEPQLQDCGDGDFGLNTVKELTLQVFDQQGQFFPAESISVSVSRKTGAGDGFICVPIPEGEAPEPGVTDCGGNGLFGPFSRFVFEESNGIERVFFFSGVNAAGTVELEATVQDPASNQLVSERYTIEILPTEPQFPVAQIPITSLTFTGPFVNAVIEGRNTLGLQAGENILQDGSYQRLISVIATDEDGNPPPGECANNDIDFFLVDGPLQGFPGQGPGAFFIAGPDGNPEEGGFTFSVPPNPGGGFLGPVIDSPVVRPLNDRLILDGRQDQNPGGVPLPNNRIFTGIWRIEQVLSDNSLAIEQRFDRSGRATPPFPQNPAQADTGPTVPYIIGSALNGNVLSRGVILPCQDEEGNVIPCPPAGSLNVFGVANTVLTYPVWRLGQTAIVVACTHFQQDLNEDGAITDPTVDRRICTVLNTCDANGANCNSVYLPVTDGTDITLTASPTVLGPNTSTPLTLCLRDRNFAPIQATAISYDIDSFLGSASVTIDGSSALSGTLQTGADGCVSVVVESTGQLPGTDPIPISFDADGVAEPVVVEIVGPGGGTISALFGCDAFCVDQDPDTPNVAGIGGVLIGGTVNCTVDLLLTDDRGGPIPDVPLSHTSDNPANVVYSPPSGNFGITDENGANFVTVSANSAALPTVTFVAGSASVDVPLTLPDCAEGEPPEPPEPVVPPAVSLLAGKTTLAPGESTTFQLVLDKPATETITVGIITAGDTGQFSLVPTSVTVAAGQSSAQFTVAADDTAADGASIQLQLASGNGYTLGDAGPITLTVGALQATVETSATAVQPGGTASFTVQLSAPATSDTTVNLVASGPAQNPPTSVLIPAGSSAATVNVNVSDTASAGDTITLTINAGSGYVVGDPNSASVPVEVPALPEATIAPTAATVQAGGSAVSLVVSLSEAATSNVTVNLSATGNTGSFTAVPGSVSIAAGSTTSNAISISALGSAQDGDSLTVTIAGGTGYTVGGAASATLTVEAAPPPDPPTADLQGSNANIAPGDSTTIAVVLSEPAVNAISVNLLITGNTGAFTVTPEPVPIAAGASVSGSITIEADAAALSGQQIQVAVEPGTGYVAGSTTLTFTVP